MKKLTYVILLISLISFISIPARTLMVHLDVQELAVRADVIVMGRIENRKCEWSLDGETIYTIVRLKVLEILKGNILDSDLVIQIPGGTVGDLSLSVSDMPEFHVEETVLVFLRSIRIPDHRSQSLSVAQNLWPSFEVYGQAQGKFSIDDQGMAVREGYDLISPEDEGFNPLTLAELKFRIHDSLRQDIKVKR